MAGPPTIGESPNFGFMVLAALHRSALCPVVLDARSLLRVRMVALMGGHERSIPRKIEQRRKFPPLWPCHLATSCRCGLLADCPRIKRKQSPKLELVMVGEGRKCGVANFHLVWKMAISNSHIVDDILRAKLHHTQSSRRKITFKALVQKELRSKC